MLSVWLQRECEIWLLWERIQKDNENMFLVKTLTTS